MLDGEVFVGDLNVPLDYAVVDGDGTAIDLSTATSKSFSVETPDGASADVTASFVTDGTDGLLEYVCPDIDQAGIWRYRAFYTNPAGTYFADWLEFLVKPNEDSPIVSDWGGDSSNSYVSMSDANAFITSSIVEASYWLDATEAKRTAALIEATRDIDSYEYLGIRYYYNQFLQFPREFHGQFPWNRAQGPNNFSIEQNRMKVAVERATCCQALWLLRTGGRNLHMERMANGIKSIQQITGQAQEMITYGSMSSATRLSPEAMAYLKIYRGQRTAYRG